MYCNNMDCCGWAEIDALSDYQSLDSQLQDFTEFFFEDGETGRCGAVQFTANNAKKGNYADKFAADLKKARLGKVKKLPVFKNPNTGNQITTYVWYPNAKRLISYCRNNDIPLRFDEDEENDNW